MANSTAAFPLTSPRPARLWLALAPALVVPLLGALIYFLWLPGGATAQAVYSGTKLFTLAWPIVAFAALLGQPLPRPAPAGRQLAALPLGIASGLAIGGLLLLAMETPLGKVVAAGAPAMGLKADALGIREHYWTFALALSLLHSGLEEYYWRWFVYGSARRLLPPAAAHGLAALAFAAHHVVVAGVFFGWAWGLFGGLCVAVGGLVWSALYQRQGTLAGAWASHAVVDLALMLIGYRLLESVPA